MANLKGGSYDKQIRDGFMRLVAFGKSRHGDKDSLTHSDGLATKREQYFRDYKKFAEENNFTQKLNLTMTDENITNFLNQRTQNLATSSSENYTRGFSSMLEGLKSKNITIPVSKDIFDSKVKEIKANATNQIITGRAIQKPTQIISSLYEKRFESGVLAQIQNDLGVRIAESYKIASDIDRYYNPDNGKIENLIGKGNHIYSPKSISDALVAKIRAITTLPSQNTYRNDLKEYGVKSHDFRYTYVAKEFSEKINNGVEYKKALTEVSQEINHKRSSMTLRYLARV